MAVGVSTDLAGKDIDGDRAADGSEATDNRALFACASNMEGLIWDQLPSPLKLVYQRHFTDKKIEHVTFISWKS